MAVQLADLHVRKEPSFGWFPALLSTETKEILPHLENAELGGQYIYFSLFRGLFHYPEQEMRTQTLEVQIDYKDLYNFISIASWFKKEWEIREPGRGVFVSTARVAQTTASGRLRQTELEQEALLSIAREFSKVEKVKSIYVQRYREELQVQILLSINQYDGDLMDVLLDLEYGIRKRYPDMVFEFFYPPAGVSEKKDFIHPQAQCIYMS